MSATPPASTLEFSARPGVAFDPSGQTLSEEGIAARFAAQEALLDGKFEQLKNIADERGKTLDAQKQGLIALFGLIGLVITIAGFFGIKQIWNVNDRLKDLEGRKKELSEQIESSKSAMTEVSRKSDQINHTVAHYLTTQWVEDFNQIMIILSANMPKDAFEKISTTINHNLELISPLKAAYERQRQVAAPAAGTLQDVTAGDDEIATILLEKAYRATSAIVNVSSAQRDRTDPIYASLLTTADTAWRELAGENDQDPQQKAREKIIPHLRAYALNVEGIIIFRRHDAFNTGETQLELAKKTFIAASESYPSFSQALSNEGTIYADQFKGHFKQAVSDHTVIAAKETLLSEIQQAIDATSTAYAKATQDRIRSTLENNLAFYFYQKASVLHLSADMHAEDAIKLADRRIEDALSHDNPSQYAYITAAEIKGQHLLINPKWHDDHDRTPEAQWEAISRLVRTACKKNWPHPARAEDVCTRCPGLTGLVVLHPTSWTEDLQAMLDNP